MGIGGFESSWVSDERKPGWELYQGLADTGVGGGELQEWSGVSVSGSVLLKMFLTTWRCTKGELLITQMGRWNQTQRLLPEQIVKLLELVQFTCIFRKKKPLL